ARGSSLAELPHAGAQRREDVRVADAVLVGLPVLLFSRAGIRHDFSGKDSILRGGRTQLAPAPQPVNAVGAREIRAGSQVFPRPVRNSFTHPHCVPARTTPLGARFQLIVTSTFSRCAPNVCAPGPQERAQIPLPICVESTGSPQRPEKLWARVGRLRQIADFSRSFASFQSASISASVDCAG